MVKPLDYTVEKYVKRATAAVEEYKFGVQHPKADWAEELKGAKERMRTGYSRALDTYFDARVDAVGTRGWQDATLQKGPSRYPEGVRLGQDKYRNRMAKVLAFEEELQRRILEMPDATLEDRIARMTTWVRETFNPLT